MSWFTNLINPPKGALLTEAVNPAIDRLERNTTREESIGNYLADMKMARNLYATNPLARALIDLPVSWLTSGGVTVRADTDANQTLVDRFWYDPTNNMPATLPRLIREQALVGEAALGVFQADGIIRVARIPADTITRVVTDSSNVDRPAVAIRELDNIEAGQNEEAWAIGVDNSAFSQQALTARASTTGLMLLWQRNRLVGYSRGSSDLLPVLRWLPLFESLVAGELDRMTYIRNYIWDIEAPTDERIKKIKDSLNGHAPTPGTAVVHGPNETWTPRTVDLAGADAAAAVRTFRNHILAVMQVPEHHLGGGGDVNRATAAEMDTPFIKSLQARQRDWTAAIKELLAIVAPLAEIEVEWPALVDEDKEKTTTAGKNLVEGLTSAIQAGIITAQEARNAIAPIMPEDFDPNAQPPEPQPEEVIDVERETE